MIYLFVAFSLVTFFSLSPCAAGAAGDISASTPMAEITTIDDVIREIDKIGATLYHVLDLQGAHRRVHITKEQLVKRIRALNRNIESFDRMGADEAMMASKQALDLVEAFSSNQGSVCNAALSRSFDFTIDDGEDKAFTKSINNALLQIVTIAHRGIEILEAMPPAELDDSCTKGPKKFHTHMMDYATNHARMPEDAPGVPAVGHDSYYTHKKSFEEYQKKCADLGIPRARTV